MYFLHQAGIVVTNALISPLSIAPMIDWTYSHFRVLMRLLAPNSLVYTEMQTGGAIQHNPQRALHYQAIEHPIALQLGGSDPKALAECARIAEKQGYDEINLNLGCPSDKVQAGHFGACLMREPAKVIQCIQSIKEAVSIPVTAKTRIGIDHQDSYEFFSSFAHQLVVAGADKLIVHARKAWLSGLNPKQNRTIPPVNYDFVYSLKQELPQVPVILNGNILTINEINAHLECIDGVMLGRLACANPYYIAVIHHALYPEIPLLKRSQIFAQYRKYLLQENAQGVSLSLLIKPLFNFAHGLAGASQWKKKLMALLRTKENFLLNELNTYLLEVEDKNEKYDALLIN